jgi:hypothetical protein
MTKNVFLLWYIADHEVTKKVRTLTINEIFSQDQYSNSYVTVENDHLIKFQLIEIVFYHLIEIMLIT